jgi:hypothetical protein
VTARRHASDASILGSRDRATMALANAPEKVGTPKNSVAVSV